jgi:hypothetical protein
MASSRPIAAGETYTPGDVNNLRADVLDPVGGHKHDGVDGARVPFSNLGVTGAAGSTPPSGGSKSYNDIANHVAGEHGVHGLRSSVYIMGASSPGFVVQGGSINLSSGIISFPLPFTLNGSPVPPISVVATLIFPADGFSNSMGVTIYSVSSTQAVVGVDYHGPEGIPTGVYWMAIGTCT